MARDRQGRSKPVLEVEQGAAPAQSISIFSSPPQGLSIVIDLSDSLIAIARFNGGHHWLFFLYAKQIVHHRANILCIRRNTKTNVPIERTIVLRIPPHPHKEFFRTATNPQIRDKSKNVLPKSGFCPRSPSPLATPFQALKISAQF
jgi:hypothetical protein